MFQLIIGFFVFISFQFAFADKWNPERNQSSLCYPKTVQNDRSIVCCDTLRGKSCEQTQKQLLSPEQIKILGDISDIVFALPEESPAVPSCFSTAMALSGMPVQTPLNLSGATDLENNLNLSYEEVSSRDMKPGDVLVLEEQGMQFKMEDNELGHKKYHFVTYPSLFNHAMVYLGEGLVIQKENAYTAVSTLSSLRKVILHYGEGNEITQHQKTMDYAYKETYLVLRVFRKKTTN